MRSLAQGLREGADARPRTLIAANENVWIWPGVVLASRRDEQIVACPRETIRFWITRWHGPEALYSEAVHFVEEAARRLARGDPTAAQHALDAIGLDRLSPDGAALMRRVADRLGLAPLDLPLRPGLRLWTARDIDLHLPFVARHFDANAPLAKFGTFDPLKHPRWPAGVPDSQGGEFRPKDSEASVVPVASRGGRRNGPPKGRTPGRPKPKANVPAATERPPLVVYEKPPRASSPWDDGLPPDIGNAQPDTPPAAEPGMGHNGGPPLGDPPELQSQPLPGKLRNLFIKSAVRWIARALVLAAFPEIGSYWAAMAAGIWIAQECLPYIRAYFQPPKTLEELQRDALTPERGYDIHHHAEQGQARKEGVPQSIWDGPENRVRVPTLKHWQITGWYMTPNREYGGLSPRNYLKGKSWEEKMRVGRDALIEFKVLKP